MQKPKLTIEFTEPELELITWRLCQPNYDEIGGYWSRHRTGKTAVEAGSELYQKIMIAWDEWAKSM